MTEKKKVAKVSPTKGKKKELHIVKSGVPSMKVIKYKDGGEVPALLQGYWNNEAMAQQQIDVYVASKAVTA